MFLCLFLSVCSSFAKQWNTNWLTIGTTSWSRCYWSWSVYTVYSQKFAIGERSLPTPLGEEIIELADKTTGDIQQLCSALWETTSHGDSLSHEHLSPALIHIFSQEIKGYEAMIVQVTAQQHNCLRALAVLGGESPYTAEFMRESSIAHGRSIKTALCRPCANMDFSWISNALATVDIIWSCARAWRSWIIKRE